MYYHRDLEERLKKSFDNHRITVVIGPRQSGKTTLIKELHDTCRLPRLYIDLDIWENQSVFQSYSEAVNFLGFHGYRKNTPFVVFLDEIQAVANISNTLKNLHDQELSLKIFATGSSSLEIFRHFRESLAGRKEIFHLYPLNFQEYMAFKDADLASRILSIPLSKIPGNIRQKISLWLKEFFVFGGYPEVALTPETESKKEIIRNIFDLFVKKDLIAHLNIKNPQTALNILRYIAINMGNVLNYSDICTSLQVDVNTLKRYLMLLNETFVLKTLPPFYTNKNKEIVRAPKIYFVDAGARNYFLKN
ncbi:MAG: ATP-binding protein, partial [Calditrichia bacterium]